MNNVTLMGRLTKEPELRTTQSNLPVASFTIAVDRRFKDASGQRQTDFLPCVIWREGANFVSKYFHKGDMIGVVGSIQTRSWDGTDGTKHYATEIMVDQAHFCGSKKQDAPENNEPDFDV